MSYEILVVLFLLLSVVSSVINKIRESRQKQQREEDRPYVPLSRQVPQFETDEDEDLAEWDVLRELEQHRRRPAEQEFREVRGTRPVSEADTGPEFREVEPTRDVEEPEGGEEFKEVRGTRQVSEVSSIARRNAVDAPVAPVSGTSRPEGKHSRRQARARARGRLNLSPKGLRRAIVLSEILGPSRADNMPW
jgi:hypothetical protein